MPLNCEQLLEIASKVAISEDLRVTVNESMKGGLIAGVGAFAGGLIAGPIGLAIGGAVGGVTAAYLGNGKFKSVPEVIQELPSHHRHELASRLENALHGVDIYDVATMITFVMGDPAVKMQILRVITEFVRNQLRMQIVD